MHNNLNIETNKDENLCSIKINTRIYSKDLIFCAAYVFIDKAYVIIDGDPDKEILVLLKPKGKCDLSKLGMDFNNELLNYAAYDIKNKQNRVIRDSIIQKALFSNERTIAEKLGLSDEDDKYSCEDDVVEPDILDIKEEALLDTKDIAIPWDDKYGKDKKVSVCRMDKTDDYQETHEKIDDPLGIFVPWDEKYGVQKKDKPVKKPDKPGQKKT
jgi:His-Xaa-Ser system protein HxsD